MRTYNKSLDCMALAVAQLIKGRPITAGQLLIKASKLPDVVEAITIIEASNKEAHGRMVAAAKQRQVAAKQAPRKQVRAAEEMEEDDAIRGLIGDNEELEGDESTEVEAGEGDWGTEEPEEAEDEAVEHEDAEITAKLAAVLSSMTKRAAAKKPVAKKR
jgi:hypothetical protein